MKCDRCGHDPNRGGNLTNAACPSSRPTPPAPCPHEPANFCANIGEVQAGVNYALPNDAGSGPTIPFRVCRLCGAWYTDLDAVIEGEKKYCDAQAAQRQKGQG